MRRNFCQKYRAELTPFCLPHSTDTRKLTITCRITPRHLTQRDVGENDVGGDIPVVGETLAKLAQPFEKGLVARDFADPMGHWFGRNDRPGEFHRLAFLKQSHSLSRETQHVILVGILRYQA